MPFDWPDDWPEAARAPFDAFHTARQAMQRRMDQSIADHAEQETLYDKPRKDPNKLRICGPFSVEAVPAPTVLSLDESMPPQEADETVARSGETSRQALWRDELLKTGVRGTRLYRYYASMDLIRNRPTGDASGPLRLPAGMVEDAVVGEIRRMIRAPEIAARTIKALRNESPDVDEKAVVQALGEFDQLWAALYPAEQTRIVQLLVERVTVGEDGIAVDLRPEGLSSVLRDMMAAHQTEACA